MNKNSSNRRRIAVKNFHKGIHETTFNIPATMPNNRDLGIRKYTISIGYLKRKSQNPKVARKGNNQQISSQSE